MRKSQVKSRLTKRVLPVVLALVLTVSMMAVAFGVIGAAAADGQLSNGEQIYFNLTKNSGWYTSGKLYALFYYNNSYVGRALCASSKRADNIYSVAVPATANSVELVVMAAEDKLQTIFDDYNSHKTHVYFDNSSKNWNEIYAYIWDASGSGKVAWPGEAMQNLSGSVWWYDVPAGYSNIIFSKKGDSQTADLGIQSDLSYYNGSTWVSVFSKTTPRLSLTSRKSASNEIYLEGSKLRLSKYPYPNHSFSNGKTVYLYNPNWTSAYVNYDLGDPYVIPKPIRMTAVSGKPAGYFQATVPADATIEFLPGTVSGLGSQQTVPPTDAYNNCYKMASGTEAWVRLQDAESVNTDYYAGIGTGYNNSDAFWVEATYFDYLTDTERSGSWLNPGYVGTVFDGDKAWQNHTKNGMNKEDNWYPFKDFNKFINNNTSNWSYPLYFGNFCNTAGSYDNGHTRNGPYTTAISGLHDFSYAANNSNALTDYHYSVQELAYDKLDSDGNIQYASGKKMPYFNTDLLKNNFENKPVAKTVKSYFPFESSSTGTGANKVTTYTFKSTTNSNHNVAQDNVFFNWSNGIPSTVNFGKGNSYGIVDGHADFVVDETNGYGIFPFNNANAGSGNPGNGQLDFGFGIRLDMDFKVPANGKLPDNSDDVKFTFTGDDDLWVYLSPLKDDGTPDYSNSKLALDLGGNHKDAEGTINFNTMQSTVKEAALLSASGTTVNASAIAKGDEVWYAWTWYNGQGGVWVKGEGSADSLTFSGLRDNFNLVRMNGSAGNNPSWDNVWNQSGDLSKQDGVYTVSGYDNGSIVGSWSGDGITYKTNYKKDINFLAGNAQLNPTTTYHMTVFYMERGLIESNSSFSFTVTPAVNDYQVQKKIDVSNVNEALADDILNRSDKFNFSTAGTYKGSSVTRGGTTLGHNETVDYYNRFDTGTTVKTTEGDVVRKAGVSRNLTFSTKWQTIDTDAGSIIDYGNGMSTRNITLQRSDGTDKPIHIKSVFTNTPSVAPLNISKTIINKDGSASDRVDNFTYTIKIDPNGGENYKAYALDYEVGGRARATDENGTFTFSSHETVTIPNLPVGVSYEITESPAAGYIAEPERITGVISSVAASNSVRFTNRINPIDSQISGVKYLDDVEYEGSAFWYELRGVAQMDLPDPVDIGNGETVSKTENTASVTQTIKSTNSSGVFNFANLVFDKAGIYRYTVYENRSIHDGTSNYILDNTVYYIEVKVVKNNDALEVAYTHKNVRYFESASAADSHTLIDDDFTSTWDGSMISTGGGTGGLPDRAIRLGDGVSITFNNYSKPGSISVTKVIQGNSADTKQFNAVVSLKGPHDDDFYPYECNYEVWEDGTKKGTYATGIDGTLNDAALLKQGRTLKFIDLPANAQFKIVEVISGSDYSFGSVSGTGVTGDTNGGVISVPVNANADMTITNIPNPKGNLVTVEKVVNSANLNSTELQNAVKTNDSFAFNAADNSGEDLEGEDFSLENGQTASYTDRFHVNSDVTVTEDMTNTKLEYNASWTVNNPVTGDSDAGDGPDATATLEGVNGYDYDYAELNYVFTNTPKTGKIELTKQITGRPDDDRMFAAYVEVSVDGGNSFGFYPLKYTIDGHEYQLDEGYFVDSHSLQQGKTIVIDKLPVGAVVRVTEDLEDDEYTFTGCTGDGTKDGDSVLINVIDGTASVTFVNKPFDVNSTAVTIEAEKSLVSGNGIKLPDDSDRAGFYFELFEEGNNTSIQETGYTIQTDKTKGKVSFTPIMYFEPTTSDDIFFIKESVDDEDLEMNYSTAVYMVRVKVDRVQDGIVFNLVPTVTYYSWSGVNGHEPVMSSAPNAATEGSWTAMAEGAARVFENSFRKGSVKVVKTDQHTSDEPDATDPVTGAPIYDNPLNNTKFALYKVTSNTDTALTAAKKVATKTTTADGEAVFDNLDIYVSNSAYDMERTQKSYQWYCLIEEETDGKHNISSEKTYFRLPMRGDGTDYDKFDVTYTFRNGNIVEPYTGMSGASIFRTVGLILIAFSAVMGLGYGFIRLKGYTQKKKSHRRFRR